MNDDYSDLSIRIGPTLLEALAASGMSILIARADLIRIIPNAQLEEDTE